MQKYDIKWVMEASWVVLVAVVMEAGQILARSDFQEVIEDPEAWGITAAGALARVAFAAIKNFVFSGR